MNIKFFRAKATFKYSVGNIQDTITVGSESSISKTEDDWKINLALQAGREVAEKHNTGLAAISLAYISMELDKEDD